MNHLQIVTPVLKPGWTVSGNEPTYNSYRQSDNVQISIDIPFADHPYLIGPRGRKCQNLMDRLKTLVHFPDSNRLVDGPKLNTVLISGPMKTAEEMRRQLRMRTPIRLNVDLESLPDSSCLLRRMEESIADRSLPIRLSYSADGRKSAVLKTEWRNEAVLVRFCNEFLADVDSDCSNSVFIMALSLLPLVNPWNAEISQWLVEYVQRILNCQVLYPPKEQFSDQAPYYFVRGSSVVRVLQATRFLFGMSMFQVSFNLPPCPVSIPESMLDEWRDTYLVHVSIEPVFKSPDGSTSSMVLHEKVTLRSFEFCINNVYSVRSQLLGYKHTVLTSEYDFMDPIIDWIPSDVFSTCKLFYPLYSIADEEAIELDTSYTSKQFFNHFYGGPYSIRHTTLPDKDLTTLLMGMLDITGDSGEVETSSRQ
jgi:hypothetical protein